MSALPKIDWETAIQWVLRDERDDFFPDVIRYRDIKWGAKDYVKINQRKLLQYSRHSYNSFAVPKTHLLKRQALLLPFSFRLVYTGLLTNLFYEIAPYLSEAAHSYRKYPNVDHDLCAYPFPSEATKTAWLGFKHGFNAALHEDGEKWGVITDITTFFERLNIDRFVGVLKDLVPPDRQATTTGCFDVLHKALLWCSTSGWGIPQNYDASSFLCSAFLTPIDRELSRIDGVYYSRWMDDIRIAAPNRGAATKALHLLQDALSRFGLGINAQKTCLLEPGSKKYLEFLAVDHDERLHRLSESLSSCHEKTIRVAIPDFVAAIKSCDESGDDRFLRAYGARLLEAAEFVELREDCLAAIRDYALKGFRERPERADWWCKFISPRVTSEVQEHLCAFLEDGNYNLHEWTNQWAVITLCRASSFEPKTIDVLRQMAFGGSCVTTRAHAISALGRAGDNLERRKLADAYLTGEAPPAIRRAAVVAVQELTSSVRDSYYELARSIDPEAEVLINFLLQIEKPLYHSYSFPERHCVSEPVEPPTPKLDGFGFVDGQWRRFKIRSRYYPDYE